MNRHLSKEEIQLATGEMKKVLSITNHESENHSEIGGCGQSGISALETGDS